MAATEVLDLLLTARYAGGPAFATMASDINELVTAASGFERVGAAFQAMGHLMEGAAIVSGLALATATKQAAEYEQSMYRLVAVHAIAADQMGTFSNEIMKASERFGLSSQNVAEGSYFLLSSLQALGYTSQDVLNNNIIPAFAAYVEASGAGRAGSVDFIQAAQDLSHVLGGMHVPISSWSGALGDLVTVENKAALSQQQLVNGLVRFAPMASTMGMSFADTVASIGALAAGGVYGARGGTELATAWRMLLTSPKAGKGLEMLGLSPSVLFDKSGALQQPDTLLPLFFSKMSKMSQKDRFTALNDMFGAVGGRAMMQLLGPQTFQYYNRLIGAEKSQGGGAGLFTTATGMINNPAGHLRQLGTAVQNTGIMFGTAVLNGLDPFFTKLKSIVDEVQLFIGQNPQMARTIALLSTVGLLGGGVGFQAAGGAISFLGRNHREITAANEAADTLFNQNRGRISQQIERTLAQDEASKMAAYQSALGTYQGRHTSINSALNARKDMLLMRRNMREADIAAKKFVFNPNAPGTRRQQQAAFNAARRAEMAASKKKYTRDVLLAEHAATLKRQGLGSTPLMADFLTPFGGTLPAMPVPPEHELTFMEKMARAPLGFFGGLYRAGSKAPGAIFRGARAAPRLAARGIGAGVMGVARGAGAVGRGIGGAFNWMAGNLSLGGGKNVIIDFFTNIGTHAKNLVGALKSLATGGFGLLKTAITGGIPALLSFIGGLLPIIGVIMLIIAVVAIVVLAFTAFRAQTMQLVGAIAGALMPIFLVLKAAFMAAIGAIQQAWAAAWPSISNAMERLFAAIKQNMPLIKFIGAIIAGVLLVALTIIVAVISGVINALSGFISLIADALSFIAGLFQFVTGILKFFWDLFHGNLPAAMGDLQTALGGLGQMFSALVAGILDFGRGILGFFVGVAQGILGMMSNIPGSVGDMARQANANITTWWNGMSSQLESGASQLGQNMGTNINNGLNKGLGDTAAPWSQLIGAEQQTGTATMVLAKKQVKYYQEITKASKTATGKQISDIDRLDAIRNRAHNHAMAMLRAEEKAREEAAARAKKIAIDAHKTLLKQAHQTAKDFMDALTPTNKDTYNAGIAMMKGLAKGIRAGKVDVVSAATGAAGDIVNAVNARLGIRSPSTVFAHIGRMSMAGFHQGFTDGTSGLSSLYDRLIPRGAGVNSNRMHIDELHVGELHAPGMNAGMQQGRQGRQDAEEFLFAKRVQAYRRAVNSQYDVDRDNINYQSRLGWQYTQ